MADYWTQGAAIFEIDNARETATLLEKLKKYFNHLYNDTGATVTPLAYKEKKVVDVLSEILTDVHEEYIEELHWALEGFEVTSEDYLYVGSDNLSTGAVADLLRVLIQIEPEVMLWKLPYACVCSKLRPDGFSGGLVVVNKDSAQVWDVESLYDDMHKLANADDRVVPE